MPRTSTRTRVGGGRSCRQLTSGRECLRSAACRRAPGDCRQPFDARAHPSPYWTVTMSRRRIAGRGGIPLLASEIPLNRRGDASLAGSPSAGGLGRTGAEWIGRPRPHDRRSCEPHRSRIRASGVAVRSAWLRQSKPSGRSLRRELRSARRLGWKSRCARPISSPVPRACATPLVARPLAQDRFLRRPRRQLLAYHARGGRRRRASPPASSSIRSSGALAEAGDLIDPIARSVIDRGRVEGELADLVTGRVVGRRTAEEITLFKSVGTALEDLAATQLLAGQGQFDARSPGFTAAATASLSNAHRTSRPTRPALRRSILAWVAP